MIDKYKIKINTYTAELEGEINEKLRTLVTSEVDVYAVELRDNQDGTEDRVYKAKVVGSTLVKQGKEKPILAKSKRSASQRLRWAVNDFKPGEDFYQVFMDKVINNVSEIWDLVKEL